MKPTQSQHKMFPMPKKMSPYVSYQLVNSHTSNPQTLTIQFSVYSFDLSTTGQHTDL